MSYHDPNTSADIENRFAYHPATTPERRDEHEDIRAQHKALAHHIDRVVPPGREKSLALTNLEQAMFWANAAIARQPD
ncbi:DUF7681 family protein [Nocardia gipuzkoensis]|uniref:Acb2/Tad1 domain-containing protein n=1 Tax=Nocardia gipuzkoensis TaxID=2749991 RepID=UPI00237E51CB|nr:hypothetical protein [Nocardia gipuzkoensis]MDE1673858.1 hypothetical protein [Nocardia gipuzkoensis]